MAEDAAAHPDGYVVTPAELVQAAQHIARLADRVGGILNATVQPPAAAPDHDREPHPPGSNAEAEQDWRADGARALAALRADSHALAATGAAYLAADRDAAALLGRCGQPNQRGDRYDTPTTPGRDAPHRHPGAAAPGQVETGRRTGGTGLGPRWNPGGAMPGAVGDDRLPGWVQRAVTARVVVDLLQAEGLALPHWQGDAADAYRDHLGGQLRVWQNLSEATAFADRLTDSGNSRDAPDAVEQRRSAQRRDGDELPTTLAAAERDDPATTGNGPAAGPAAPANPAGERTRPHTDIVAAPVRSASAQRPADTPEQARHTAPGPMSIPDSAAGDGQPADRNGGDHAIADGSSAAGDAPVLLGVGTQILTATPAAAAAALPHHAHASAPTRTSSSYTDLPSLPLGALGSRPAASTRPATPDRPSAHPAAAAQQRLELLADVPPCQPDDGPPRDPGPIAAAVDTSTASAGWVTVGAHPNQPVWINLGATGGIGGIGLQGPGATNAARTLIAALLHALPATTVVSDRYTVAALLGAHPHQRLHTGDDRAPAHRYRRVHVVDHPRDVLDYAHAHLHQHAPTTPTAAASPPAMVLVLPSPTNPATRDALAATLRRGRPHGVVALLHGPWPLGWNCHLDEHHRITRHSPVDPHDSTPAIWPAHLTGATIAATSTTDLRALLDAVPGLDDPPDVPAHPCPPAGPRPLAATAPDPGPTTIGERTAVDTAEPDAAPTAQADAENGAAQPIPPTISTSSRETAGRDPDRANAADDAADGAGMQETDDSENNAGIAAGEVAAPRWRSAVLPLRLSILGATALHHLPGTADTADPVPAPTAPVAGLGPRATELLVYLGVHPQGVHRDALVAALWPDTGPRRPTNALNSTLTRLRRTLRSIDPGLVALAQLLDGRYQLHPELISVDYWDFLVAATDLTNPDPAARRAACNAVVALYRGPLGADHDGEWLMTLREATRRRYLEALTALARMTIVEDPERTLELLETARNLEPLNEAIYRDIIRIQHRLGRPDDAALTLALLQAQLADIDATPQPATLALAHTPTTTPTAT